MYQIFKIFCFDNIFSLLLLVYYYNLRFIDFLFEFDNSYL